MKKLLSLLLSIIMILSLTACGTKAEASWQEQYDLGMKYVNETKYEEAILAFTKAIEIDPKLAPAYIELANIYIIQDSIEKAAEILNQGNEYAEDKSSIEDKLKELSPQEDTIFYNVDHSVIFPIEEIPNLTIDKSVIVDYEVNEYNNNVTYGYDSEGYEITYVDNGSPSYQKEREYDNSRRIIKQLIKEFDTSTTYIKYIYEENSTIVGIQAYHYVDYDWGEWVNDSLSYVMRSPENKVIDVLYSQGSSIIIINSVYEYDAKSHSIYITEYDENRNIISQRKESGDLINYIHPRK